ncbi:MAG TPA: hypothetical protein VGH11_18990 [Jatrophihabitans sp.]|jgi:hypothetical protein
MNFGLRLRAVMPTLLATGAAVTVSVGFVGIAGVTGIAGAITPEGPRTLQTGTFVAQPSTPVMDTRSGSGGVPKAPLAALHTVRFKVGAVAGSTVALHVVVASSSASGWLAAYPDGGSSSVSVVNYVHGQQQSNLALVQVGTGGYVDVTNHSSGWVELAADVSGYYVGGSPAATAPGSFVSQRSTQVLDTRSGLGGVPKAALAAQRSLRFKVGAPAGSTVALHVVVASSSKSGWLAAYPDGTSSAVSVVNYSHGQQQSNLALVLVGSGGYVDLMNHSTGWVQVAADVSGSYVGGAPLTAGTFVPVSSTLAMDTRTGAGGVPKTALGAGRSVRFKVAGLRGIAAGSTVGLHVVVASSTKSGWIAAYPSGGSSNVSVVNYVAGLQQSNLTLTRVGPDGYIYLANHSTGSVQLSADVSGYQRSADLVVPLTSTSRYVRNISGATSDASTMYTEGCTDAQGGSALVLLDIGAQSVTAPLSPSSPGVTLTGGTTRLTYPQLVTAINGYLDGFAACPGSQGPATIVISTNNDGVFSGANGYPAEQRGIDWAAHVIAPLQGHAAVGLTVLGGNDIESGDFAGDELQAEQWETNYLANPTVGTLIYNGSADGCPTNYGAVNQTCGQGWTQAQYYKLTHGLSPSRIKVLPQVYTSGQALQWANIDATGGNGLVFAGALTEYAACPTATSPGCVIASLQPSEGWASLLYALANGGAAAPPSVVTDLQVDN